MALTATVHQLITLSDDDRNVTRGSIWPSLVVRVVLVQVVVVEVAFDVVKLQAIAGLRPRP